MAGKMGKPRKSGNPAQATVRKISLLLDLVRNKRISLRASERHYGCSERTLLRDLQELRTIGETAGFRISDRQPGDIFELSEFKAQPTRLVGAEKRLRQLIAELLKAFGEPTVRAAGDIAKTKDGDPSFLGRSNRPPRLRAPGATTSSLATSPREPRAGESSRWIRLARRSSVPEPSHARSSLPRSISRRIPLGGSKAIAPAPRSK